MAALKVIAILATALFGIFASFAEFRDRRGRITASGWIGLSGVIASGLLAAGLQLYADREQERSTMALLTEIERAVQPLNGITISYRLKPDWEAEGYQDYFAHFGMQEHLQPAAFGNQPFPSREEYPFLWATLCWVDPDLYFFRTPINVTNFLPTPRDAGEELRISSPNPCRIDQQGNKESRHEKSSVYGSYSWHFGLANGKLMHLDLEVTNYKPDPTWHVWKSTGTITSLQDLLGSQLIIQLDGDGASPDMPPEQREERERLRRQVELTALVLRLPSGVVLSFDRGNLVRSVSASGFHAYSIVFPNRMDELLRLARYDQFKLIDAEMGPD